MKNKKEKLIQIPSYVQDRNDQFSKMNEIDSDEQGNKNCNSIHFQQYGFKSKQQYIQRIEVNHNKKAFQFFNYVENKKDDNQIQIQKQNVDSQPGSSKLNYFIITCQKQKIIYYTFKQLQYDLVILMENKLFYCKSESFKDSKIEVQSKKYNKIFNFQSKSIKELKNEIQGKLYSTQLDKNQNPKYNIQEGIFSFDLEQKKIKLIKKDKEYLGKSNILLHENTQKPQDETNKTKHQELRSQSLPSRKKIIIKEDGIIVNNRQIGEHRRQFQKLKIWCKYNQSLNERDEQILKNKQWLTSSIIDSFVFHLNLEGEKEYIKQKENNYTKQINRILFLPTSLTTNFGIQYDFYKAQQLFQQELLEYQEMNFQLNLIYDKIGIPINKNNIHWQFLLFDYKKNCVELFDSLSYSFKFDQNLIETLAQLLNFQNCEQKKHYYFNQQNGYACGYYVCSFMYYQYRLQFDKNLEKYSYIEEQITKLLLDVIKDQENQ